MKIQWKHFRPRRAPVVTIEREQIYRDDQGYVRVSDGVLHALLPFDWSIRNEPWLTRLALDQFNFMWLEIIRARTPIMRCAYRRRRR